MNYARIYEAFIADRLSKQNNLEKGTYDRHHIHPRCLGGTDDPTNIVRLLFSDHLFAHVLLAKIHGGVLRVSAVRMSGMKKYNVGRSRRLRYQGLREAVGRVAGERFRGKPLSEEHKAKIAAAQKGRKPPAAAIAGVIRTRTGKPLSPETIAKLRVARRGRTPNKGNKHSEETKQRMSESQKRTWASQKAAKEQLIESGTA